MRVLTLTVAAFEENARKVAGDGAEIMVIDGDFIRWPQGQRYDLLLVFLHPSADGKGWVDDHRRLVATTETVRQFPLDGTVVFLGVCYGLENKAMIEALQDAGAGAVIAGPGTNYGGAFGMPAGSDVMAMALRGALQIGTPVAFAWDIARIYARAAALRGIPRAKDALDFEMVFAGESHRRRWGCLGGVATLVFLLFAMMFGSLLPTTTTFDSVLPTSPISTPTPVATFTPWWVPIGTEVPWPTPTSCISGFGCEPVSTTIGVAYYTYIPAILSSYGWYWESELYVNDALATSPVITYGDTVLMLDTIYASGQTISFTLIESWSASLTKTAATANGGVVDDGTNAVTWTVGSSTYDVGMRVDYDVVSGTFASDLITRVLTMYANGVITPTVYTETETITHQ